MSDNLTSPAVTGQHVDRLIKAVRNLITLLPELDEETTEHTFPKTDVRLIDRRSGDDIGIGSPAYIPRVGDEISLSYEKGLDVFAQEGYYRVEKVCHDFRLLADEQPLQTVEIFLVWIEGR